LDRDVWEAIEYETVRGGRRLADLSWREIKVLVRHAEPGSAIFRATFGEQATWGAAEHLLAGLVDLTNMLVWMKSADGQKNRNRPKPIQRPADKEASLLDAQVTESGAVTGSGGRLGSAMTIDELEALFARTLEH
jgi:hypothetical protein